jgi:hypothetical protein
LPNQPIRALFPRLIGITNVQSVDLGFNTPSMFVGPAITVQMVTRPLTSIGIVDNGHQLQSNTRSAKMNDPENLNFVNAQRCEILGISAATCGGEKLIPLTLRMTSNSFIVTSLTFSLLQGRERFQADLADLLARHPLLKEESCDAP